MNWKNLKKNKCPFDGKLLEFNSKVAYCECTFVIGIKKLERISETPIVLKTTSVPELQVNNWWDRD